MVITHNEKTNTYSINDISQEELLEINQLIEHAGLSVKRSFYNVQKSINEFIKRLTQPKKVTHVDK